MSKKVGFSAVELCDLEKSENVIRLSVDRCVLVHLWQPGTSLAPDTSAKDEKTLHDLSYSVSFNGQSVKVNRRALITLLQEMGTEEVLVTVNTDHPLQIESAGRYPTARPPEFWRDMQAFIAPLVETPDYHLTAEQKAAIEEFNRKLAEEGKEKVKLELNSKHGKAKE